MRWDKLQLYMITFENFHYDEMISQRDNRNNTLKENMKHKKYRLKHRNKEEKVFIPKTVLRKKVENE